MGLLIRRIILQVMSLSLGGFIASSVFMNSAIAGDIHDAVRTGNLKKIQELVSSGRDINSRDDDGNTPFIVACENEPVQYGNGLVGFLERFDKVKARIPKGSSMLSRNKYGQSAFSVALKEDILAAKKEQTKILLWLIENGADIRAKNKKGMSAIHPMSFGAFHDPHQLLSH